MASYPLDGYRVVDFGSAWAGPQMTHIVADMGAEVIKVESRNRIDYGRMGGAASAKDLLTKTPEAIVTAAPDSLELNPVFHLLNRGKLGITVDFTKPKGADLIKELIKKSDIVADNFTPGVLDKYSLGYESLAEIKPDIIVVSLCFAGHTGPLRGTRGYAPIITALAGLDSVVGYPDETIPCGPRFAFGDHVAATHGALAMLVALIHRNRTGEGQYIDMSAREASSVLIGDSLMDYTMNKRTQRREGNRDEVMAPHNCYRCRGEDKWVSIAIATEEEWQAFCHAIGDPEWANDARFSNALGRWQHQEEMDRMIQVFTLEHTHYEVMDILQKAGVAAIPSFNAAELCSDRHLDERGLLVVVDHPTLGAQMVFSPPWKMSLTPAEILTPGPPLGQHNEYVFCELLGLSQAEYSRLVEKEVIC